jgi:hypothetical protein
MLSMRVDMTEGGRGRDVMLFIPPHFIPIIYYEKWPSPHPPRSPISIERKRGDGDSSAAFSSAW